MSKLVRTAAHDWQLVVDPDRGGKVTSLRDPSGLEWLAQATGSPPPPGADFVDAEMAGWDECAPSILACEVDGRQVPDHGSLWNQPFTVEGDLMRVVDPELGFELTRRISIDSEGVLFEYTAVGTRRQPFLWAAHPQFVSPPGTRVELPPHITRLVDVTAAPATEVSATEFVGGAAGLAPRTGQKYYLRPTDRASRIVLRHPDGRGLAMSWSDACPYLGIWLDNACYSREPVVALEPATGYYDSVAQAARSGLVAWLVPGAPLTWWVRLSQAPSPTDHSA